MFLEGVLAGKLEVFFLPGKTYLAGNLKGLHGYEVPWLEYFMCSKRFRRSWKVGSALTKIINLGSWKIQSVHRQKNLAGK